MPGSLSDGEIQALTAYIRSLGAGPREIRTPGVPPLSSRVPGAQPERSPAMVPGAPVSDTPGPCWPGGAAVIPASTSRTGVPA